MTTFQPPHNWTVNSIFDKLGKEYQAGINHDGSSMQHCSVCALPTYFNSNFCRGDACFTQLLPVGCEFYFNSYCDDSEVVLNGGDIVTVMGHSEGMVNVNYQSSTFPRENTTPVWPEELDPTCLSCIADKHS